MLCKDCPFMRVVTNFLLQTKYVCQLDNEPREENDECFFPETIMEKGV